MASSNPALVAVMARDLIFLSKISAAVKAAGKQNKTMRTAADVASVFAEEPALIVLDLNALFMPLQQVLDRARQQCPQSRVVAYFSHVDHELAEEAKSLGLTEVYPRSKFVQIVGSLVS
jgi:DNA-binding NarL/FixJ family response regulator